MLDNKTKRRVEKFTAQAGVSPEYFLSKIANEWLDEKGDYVLGRLKRMRKPTIVESKPVGKKKRPSTETAMIRLAPILLPAGTNRHHIVV